MKVLLAEDSPTMRHLLSLHLRQWDYDVDIACDGQEAWTLFQSGNYPLVLTDWMMPEMDGVELIRRIRAAERTGYVYIVLLTAKAEKEALVEAMEAGADDYLAKPFDREELRVRLREGERIIRLEQTLAEQNRQLRETQAALVQSEKLAGHALIAAGMAHEINNPIAFVTNNLAVLERDLAAVFDLLKAYRASHAQLADADPAEAGRIEQLAADCDLEWVEENLPQLFASSKNGLTRVRDIVTKLRDFARLDEAETDEVDLNELLQAVVDIMRHEFATRRVTVRTELGPVPPLHCQPAKLNQAFANILRNAVQASEPGGRIDLRTRADDAGVMVEIEDRGTGIERSDLPRIFEPFFTTRPVGSGRGLGLAVSYGIIEQHGGTIGVQTELGRGTTVTIALPLHPPVGDGERGGPRT